MNCSTYNGKPTFAPLCIRTLLQIHSVWCIKDLLALQEIKGEMKEKESSNQNPVSLSF